MSARGSGIVAALLIALAAPPALLAGDEDPPAPPPAPAGPATAPPSRPAPPRPEPTPRVTAAEILHSIAWLADDARAGRLAGTAGADDAATWIAARMDEAGLTPPPAGGRFQEFLLPPSDPIPEKCSLEVRGPGGKSTAFAPGTGFAVLGGSAADVDAPAAFAGYGISNPRGGYDDYAGLDVTGRVVVVLRHEPRERDGEAKRWSGARMTMHASFAAKALAAGRAGAAALVVVTDPLNHPEDSLAGLSTGGLPPGIAIPVVFAARPVADAILQGLPPLEDLQREIDAADAPASRLLGETRVRLRTAYRPVMARNVLGAVRGTDPALREEWVVVGAHYDHVGDGSGGGTDPARYGEIHNGADDNASGTAAMLEIAQSLALGERKPRRSVLFVAFSAEEAGLLGSHHYVEHPVLPLAKCVAMLNLDMVGRYGKGTFEVVGAASGTTLVDAVSRAAEGLDLEFRHTSAGIDRSDGFNFYRKSVPTLFLFTGIHKEYHRPGDDWWLIDGAATERVTTMALRLVLELTDADLRPEFREIPKESMGRLDSRRVVLGVTFLDEAAAAILGSVLDGSPAAKAGLVPGDTIVRFGPAEVAGSGDLRKALAATKPGATVEVEYLREGRRSTTKVSFPE